MSPALIHLRTLLVCSLTLATACSNPTTPRSVASESAALVPEVPAWTARLGGSGADQLNGVAIDSTGALIVAGNASTAVDGQSFGGTLDGLVAKYSSTGTKQWTRLAGTSASESFSAVAVGSSDAIYVAGADRSSIDGQPFAGGTDFWLSKYDASGTKQWTRTAGTAGNDGANAVAFQGGGVYVAGVAATALPGSTAAGRNDAAVLRYDESGTQSWAVSYGTTLDDAAAGIAVDASGNVYVAGTTSGAFSGNTAKGGKDIFLTRMSAAGAIAWTKQVGTSADDSATGVAIGGDGGIYVSGITAGALGGTAMGSTDAVLIKFDVAGAQLWAKQLGSLALDEALGVAADASAVYLTGRSLGQLPGANAGGLINIFAAQYAFDGTAQFVREFSGGNSSGTSFGAAVAAANGRVLVVGGTSALTFDGVASLGNNDGLVFSLCSGNNFACQTAGSCSVNRGGCSASQTCTAGTAGTVLCSCAAGMTGSTTCSDVNECLVSNGGCDALTTCANTFGARTCGSCPGGYTGNGATGCVDVNECANGNGGCALGCINLPGTFRCGCSAGYDGDGITCTDIDECARNHGGCDALTTCTNTTGSYTCGDCPTGYSGSGATGCVDIDECTTNNGGCAGYQTCTNIVGSRLCGCPAGYVDSGTACLKVGPAWTARVGTTGTDQTNAVAIDSAGNVIVAGSATGTLDGQASAGAQDAFVAKYSFSGAKLWSRQAGTSQADAAAGVAIGSDDSVFVTGFMRASIDGQTALGGADLWLARYDASGTRLWSRLLGTAANDSGSAVAVRSGAVYVAGIAGSTFAGSVAAGRNDIALARYDENGTLSWAKSFGSTQDDAAAGVAIDTLGNVYIAGTAGAALPGSTAIGGKDIFLAKYDGTGARLWIQQVGTAGDDTGTGVVVGADGGIYVSGITAGPGSTDALLMKFDPSGAIVWTQQLGSPALDEGLSVAADDAFVYLTGRSLGQLPGANAGAMLNLFAAKYDLAGNLQTVREYSGGNSTGTTLGTSVAAAGGRLVIGGATSATTFDGVTTIGGTDGLALSLCTGNGFACVLEGTCTSNRGGCTASQTCTADTPGYVICSCGLGYTGSSVCTDVNECLVNNGGCDPLSTCTNAIGSRSCGACPSGYTGTGTIGCTPINNCLTGNGGCDANATCTMTGPATNSCACNTGYSGNGTTSCTDIDECATHNGGCDAVTTCTNTAGSFTCGACPAGYTGTSATGCIDIDECATNDGGCDALTTCTNTPGSLSCSPCPSGYTGTGLTGCTVFVGPPAQLVFTVQPSTAQAGALISPAVQVTVEDALGHPVLTDSSAVTLTLSTGALSGTKTVTAVNGVATFSDLSVSLAGTGYTLTASAGALTAATSSPFNILTGAPARAVFTASPETTVAGTSLTPEVVVTLEDASGNVITSATDPVTVAIGTHGGPGTLSGTTTVDAVAGVARFSDLSIDKSGAGYTLVASVPGYQGGTSGTFDIGPGAISGARSSLIASETSIAADGLSFATLTVTVLDANQNPIADQLVTFEGSGSNNVFTPTTCSTDLSGACAVTISSTLAQTETITAAFGAAEATTTITFVPGAPSAEHSTIAFSPLNVIAGVTWATISVTVVDAQGNPLPDEAVELSPSGVMNVVEPVSGTTDANGHFSALLTTMVAQSETVTALIGAGIDALTVTSSTLTFVPGAPSSSASSVAVQPGPFVAGTSTTVTVVALDVNANAIPNAMVTLSAGGAGNTFSPASGLTDASGTFVATLASTMAQSETVTATIGTDHLAQVTSGAVTFTPGEPAAALSTATASSSTITAGTSTDITVTVRDALGNVVPGTPVAVWSDGAGNLFTPSAGTTGADGTFVSSFSSTLVQSVTVTASIGQPEPFTLTVDPIAVGPGPLSIGSSHMYVTGGPITADGLTQATVMVTSQDDYGNPAVGATFTLSASPPEGITIGPQLTQTADAHGAAVFVVTATTAGNRTLSGTVNGTPLWDLPQLKVLYPAIGPAVAPVKISGAVSGCTTASSHASRKIAVDAANEIYVAMNCAGTGYVATSRDGGATWSAPVSTGITGLTGTNELHIAAGEKNLAYVVGYSGASTILFSMTFDGGASWSAPWPVGGVAQAPYGLAIPNIALRDTTVLIGYLGVGDATGPSGTKVYANTTSGAGEFTFRGRSTMPTADTFYWRLLMDPVSGHLYDINEDNSLFVSTSTDNGATWGATMPVGILRGAYSSWALGGGFIYNAGAVSYASRIALADIDQANQTSAASVPGTALTGLQTGVNGQAAVDADALGNGYFVTTTSSGEIDLQAVLATSTSIGPITRVVASGGSHPIVRAGPQGSALVSYTSGGAVYSTVVVPQLTPTPGQAITSAVAPILISGSLANCSTQYSNTSQKIATDAGHVIYALMNCGGTAYVAVSLDGGASFRAPVNTGLSGVLPGTHEMVIAAGALGTAWVAAYTNANTIAFTSTNNGGAGWARPVTIGGTATLNGGLGLVSLASIGTDLFAGLQTSTGTKVYKSTNSGTGAFTLTGQTTLPNAKATYWRLLADQTSGDLFHLGETNSLSVTASANGGTSWGATIPIAGAVQGWSSWASGGGLLYNAGGKRTAYRVSAAAVHQADITTSASSVAATTLYGVIPGQPNQTAIAADGSGNAFIVTSSTGGAIQVQSIPAAYVTVGPAKTVVASGGSWPAILTGDAGSKAALVTYTFGGGVYSSVVVAPGEIEACPVNPQIAGPQNDCSGVCINPYSNAAHCGGCGNACPEGKDCANGKCYCQWPTRACGDKCVPVTNDPKNCDGCGKVCNPGEVCISGGCYCDRARGTSCSSPSVCINGLECRCPDWAPAACGWFPDSGNLGCADLQNDKNNCGRCGHACNVGEVCCEGTCKDQSQGWCCSGAWCDRGPDNLIACCNGVCTNTVSDSSNCGGCGQICTLGAGGTGIAQCNGAGSCACSFGNIACKIGATNTTSCQALLQPDPNSCKPGDACYCGNYSGNNDCGCCGHKCPDNYQCVLGLCMLK